MVLGADVGSTNVKVVALRPDGRVVARARRATPRHTDDPSIDALELFALLEDLVVEACGDSYSVTAICVAGIGEDGVLVGDNGIPLGRALAWFDPRRARLFSEIESGLPPADGLGVTADPARTLVGWTWARRQQGDARARSWLSLTDFASCRWSDVDFLSDTLAARTSAWRIATRTWTEDRIRATLGSPALLPKVVRAGEIVGPLRSARLREAGVLGSDAVVVAGGHDHPIGGWGVEQLSPGAILDSMGTAEVVVAQAIPGVEANERVDIAPGIGGNGTTVLRVEELARNVEWAGQDPAVAAAIRRLISGDLVPDDHLWSGAFVPGAAGGARPRYAPDAPPAPESRASAVLGALAVLGGDAIRDVAALMSPHAAVFTAGGWARSPGWLEIKRAVTGRPVTVITEPETTAAGAALLAADAIGLCADPVAALTPEAAPALPRR